MKLFSGTPLSQFSDRRPAEPAAVALPPRRGAGERTDAVLAAPDPTARASSRGGRRVSVALPSSPPTEMRIVPIPRLAIGGRWRVEAMRSLSEPLLLWFTRGQGRITVGGVTRGYGVHNAVFIPAGVMHGFEVGSQTFGTALFFGRAHGLDLPEAPQHLRIRDVGPQTELTVILDNIQRELESTRPSHERAARLHLGLLAVWLDRQLAVAGAEPVRQRASLRLARRYAALLERDFSSGKGVGDYARDLGVTPTHLSRVCNQTCGRSASDLLHDRVIFEARRLLSETRLPISDIADALGFTSAAYFTRAFQHRTGKTPSAFRKQG